MSNYRRLISYIYAYEGGTKGKNIGFAKIEIRNGQCRIHVNVKRIFLGSSDIGVYLLSPQKEISLGRIFIRNGAGEFRTNVNAGDVENSGYGMDQCYGLTIHETESTWRTYTTIWEDAVAQAAEVELANVTAQEAKGQPEEQERFSVSEEIRQELEREEKEKGEAPWREEGMWQPGEENPADGVGAEREMAQEDRGSQPGREDPERGREEPGQEREEGAGNLVNGEIPAGEEESASGENPVSGENPASGAENAGGENPASGMENARGENAASGTEGTGGENPEEKNTSPTEKEDSFEEGWKRGTAPEPLWRGGTLPGEEMPRPGEGSVQEKVLRFARVLLQGKVPGEGNDPGQEAVGKQPPAAPPMPSPAAPPMSSPAVPPMPSPAVPPMPSPPAPSTPMKRRAPSSRPEPGDPARLAELDRLEQEEMSRGSIWKQLQRRYAKVLAFDYADGCEILSIKPQDIGMLPRENWIYGNNSFLLHGYYNYRHLILARLENPKGEPRYLLGVPGHYFSNEKNLASMFGFPYFVLAKKQPEQDGRFGYWYTDLRL